MKNLKNTAGKSTLNKWRNFFYYNSFITPAIKSLKKVNGKALDLGCGDGKVTRELIKNLPNLKFVGLDQKKTNLEFEFINGKAEKLPFKNRYFDAVTCFEVLEHLEKPEIVFKEIRRVLKPKGIFYFTTPLEGDPNNLYGNLYLKKGYDPHRKRYGHIQKYSTKIITIYLRSNGFKIKKVTYTAHLVNQTWTIFLNKINKPLKPLTFVINLVAGLESILSRKSSNGLDIQVTAIKK